MPTYSITLNLRNEWVSVFGQDRIYIKSIIDNCFGVPTLMFKVSSKARKGFKPAALKPSNSGYSFNIKYSTLNNTANLLEIDTVYNCELVSDIEGIKTYSINMDCVWDQLFDTPDTLTFSVSNPWYANGRNERSRLSNDAFQEYRRKVNEITNRRKRTSYFKTHINRHGLLETKDHLQGRLYETDHMISVKYGFDNDLPPEIVGSLANLQVITKRENASKGSKNSITVGKLYDRYYKLKEKNIE